MKKANSFLSLGTILVYILIIAVIVGTAAVVYRFTGGFTGDFRTFYLRYEGTDIFQDTSFNFKRGQAQKIYCVYTLDAFFESDETDYTVRVLSYATKDNAFFYAVNEELMEYSSGLDLTEFFIKEKHKDYFVLDFPTGKTPQQVLVDYYAKEGKTVLCDGTEPSKTIPYYELVVTAHNKSTIIRIAFGFDVSVESIEVNAGEEGFICFGG